MWNITARIRWSRIGIFIRRLHWQLFKKDYITYPCFWCHYCGKYVDRPIRVASWESCNEWWDTWGTCDECEETYFKRNNHVAN